MPCLAQVLARPRKASRQAPEIAAGAGADLAACDLAADVVLGPIGVQRHRGMIQHPQQVRLVGPQSCQQAIERGKAGATAEDAVDPRAQRLAPASTGTDPISLEISVELPNQRANLALCQALLIGERIARLRWRS